MGIEPTNGGSKIRCLASWLLPEKEKIKNRRIGTQTQIVDFGDRSFFF